MRTAAGSPPKALRTDGRGAPARPAAVHRHTITNNHYPAPAHPPAVSFQFIPPCSARLLISPTPSPPSYPGGKPPHQPPPLPSAITTTPHPPSTPGQAVHPPPHPQRLFTHTPSARRILHPAAPGEYPPSAANPPHPVSAALASFLLFPLPGGKPKNHATFLTSANHPATAPVSWSVHHTPLRARRRTLHPHPVSAALHPRNPHHQPAPSTRAINPCRLHSSCTLQTPLRSPPDLTPTRGTRIRHTPPSSRTPPPPHNAAKPSTPYPRNPRSPPPHARRTTSSRTPPPPAPAAVLPRPHPPCTRGTPPRVSWPASATAARGTTGTRAHPTSATATATPPSTRAPPPSAAKPPTPACTTSRRGRATHQSPSAATPTPPVALATNPY